MEERKIAEDKKELERVLEEKKLKEEQAKKKAEEVGRSGFRGTFRWKIGVCVCVRV